uniref:Uncharacterized protein n=1 Tax=Anguilla anguilla TaxID=7936 RepID=A0A0E9PNC1_ANGAN
MAKVMIPQIMVTCHVCHNTPKCNKTYTIKI